LVFNQCHGAQEDYAFIKVTKKYVEHVS
jgi:hypothetical protein